MNLDVVLEFLAPPTHAAVGETVPLRLVVRRPAHAIGPVSLPFVNHKDAHRVRLDTELFQPDVVLRPGECYLLALGVRFLKPGAVNLGEFYLQVAAPDQQQSLAYFPEQVINVTPTFGDDLETSLTRVCTYDNSVRVEMVIRYKGGAEWREFEIVVGPPGTVLAGITTYRLPKLIPDWEDRIEIVTSGAAVELTFRGSTAGQSAQETRHLAIPPTEEVANTYTPFTFLEPRLLTSDRVTIEATDSGAEIFSRGGIFVLKGAGNQYKLTIYPNHSDARAVTLLHAAGQIEVKPMIPQNGAWSFHITAISYSAFTTPVRLYYDVELDGRILRGEIHIILRPSQWRVASLAATFGVAITVKGFAGAVPTLVNPSNNDDLLAGLFEVKAWDWAQLLSIGLIWLALYALDRVLRLLWVR